MKLIHFALTATLALAALAAGASVVTVDPSNMESLGWSIVTNQGGTGALTTRGPATYELAFPWNTDLWGMGIDLGRGAFLATCGFAGVNPPEDNTPSTVWLGLDKFNGQPLAGVRLDRIKTMTYYAYVSKIATRHGGDSTLWDSWTWWRFPGQPIMLQITCQAPASFPYGAPYNRAQLLYRPWGTTIKGDDLNEYVVGLWTFYDCINQGRWMLSPGNHNQSPVPYESWADALSAPIDVGDYHGSLAEWTLMATSYSYEGTYGTGYKSPGWNNSTSPPGWTNTTGTGKTLNFEVGARLFQIKWPGATTMTAWWPESALFRGHMDFFTLGIDKNSNGHDNDPGEKFTYNFEPADTEPDPRIAYVNQSVFATNRDGVLRARPDDGIFDNLFKVSGWVTATGNLAGNPWFELDDGTGLTRPTRVYTQRIQTGDEFGLAVGQRLEAWGLAERPRWTAVGAPYLLWADVSNVRQLQ